MLQTRLRAPDQHSQPYDLGSLLEFSAKEHFRKRETKKLVIRLRKSFTSLAKQWSLSQLDQSSYQEQELFLSCYLSKTFRLLSSRDNLHIFRIISAADATG